MRRMPLTSAFSNKAVTIVWGIVWGALFFSEPITVSKVAGAALIIAGVVLFAHADGEGPDAGAEGADDAGSSGAAASQGASRDENALLGADGVIIDG